MNHTEEPDRSAAALAAAALAAAALAAPVAAAIVDACLARSPLDLVPQQQLGPLVQKLALAALRSPEADAALRALLQAASAGLRERSVLRAGLPPELLALLHELCAWPYTPERELIVGVLSLRPCQRLTRELMVGTLRDYSARLRATLTSSDGASPSGSAGAGRGLLGRLATEAVRKSTSALGTLAPGMTSAVTDELSRQLQRRSAEFAEGASDELVQRIATLLTDPARAAEHTELKRSLLDFILDRPGAQIAKELDRMQAEELLRRLRGLAAAWLEREAAAADLVAALSFLATRLPAAAPIELLGRSGALPAVRELLCAFLIPALTPLVQSGALLRLLAPPPA